MPYEILSPPVTHSFYARELKRAREKLDRTAVETRTSWKELQAKAIKLFGKANGLTIAQCKKLTQELKKK